MVRIIRRANWLLLVVVLWQGYLLLSHSQAVRAATTPFLGRPFYGAAVILNARFDHKYPDYDVNQNNNALGRFTRYDGVDQPSCQSADFCYSGHDGVDFNLIYQPVVAAAAGTIVFAGWANTNHDIDLGLMVKLDHGNSHRTLYGHLSMLRYQSGMAVGRWQIGTSGTTGNSTGPHLHFGVQFNTSGSTWKIKDPYSWTGTVGADPWEQTLPDGGGGVQSEFLWLPEPQRTTDPPPNNGTWDVDDNMNTSTVASGHGCASGNYWNAATTANAVGGALLWTYANGQTPNCYAQWQLNFPDSGQYEVLAYVPAWDMLNRTQAARYEIRWVTGGAGSTNQITTVVVDQRRVNFISGNYQGAGQWISLGRYNFGQGFGVYGLVKVIDAAFVADTSSTGIYVDSTSHTVLADAVRFVKTH